MSTVDGGGETGLDSGSILEGKVHSISPGVGSDWSS